MVSWERGIIHNACSRKVRFPLHYELTTARMMDLSPNPSGKTDKARWTVMLQNKL
jgi:hypothetical protein